MFYWLRDRVLYYIFFYVAALALTAVILIIRYNSNTNEYIRENVHGFDQRMENFQLMQQKMMDNYYALFLDSPEVTAIMEKASTADAEGQKVLRAELMGDTAQMFASLKDFDVRLLFFHLPGQISFLRLHKPEKFGDSLTKARPSVVQAQKTRRKLVAFETGKLFDGFRTIYPLFHQGRFVGTVEIAYPFAALKNQALRQVTGAYTFLVKRSLQESKSKAPVIATYYQDSPFGNQYYEDKESALIKGANGFTEEELKKIISLNRLKIQAALKQEKLQGIALPYDGQYALMVLKPVKELGGGHAAYMVEITPNHVFFKNEINQLIEILALVGILLALLMWYFYRYQRSTIVLSQYKKAIDEDMIVSKTDRTGIITYVNERFIEISGYSEKELLGKPHRLIRHPDTPSEVFKEMWQTIQQGKIWHGTIQNRRKDGSAYYVNSTIFPILDENGKILEYVGLREDITQLVESTKREEKLRIQAQRSESAKMEFLANMSHEIRTPLNGIMGFAKLLSDADLPSQSHRHAQIISEQSKTLMGVINDILDLSKIESGNLALESIQINPFVELESAFSLFYPVAAEKGIEYYIRLDSTMSESIALDVLRLKQIMTNLISNALKFTPAGGSISVEVNVQKSSETHQKLRFSVSDSGIGIAKEKLQTIFSPFVQEDSSTTRQFGGTGLGLSISSNLVRLFGGELKVESEKGEGSRFWFDIDVEIADGVEVLRLKLNDKHIGLVFSNHPHYSTVKAQLEAFNVSFVECDGSRIETADETVDLIITFNERFAQQLASDDSPYSGGIVLIGYPPKEGYEGRITAVDYYDHCPSQLYNTLLSKGLEGVRKRGSSSDEKVKWSDKRVLVADDYEVNRLLIDALLQAHGITPDFAENGKVACDMVSQNHYDLVFMDINMPVMDGMEATRIIREDYPELPVVALTANALDGDRERFMGKGMSGYLSKPIDTEHLNAVLAEFLGSGRTDSKVLNRSDASGDSDIYAEAKAALKLPDEVLLRLFNAFASGLEERLESLKEAIEAQELEQIERDAHSIKGSAANLCLKLISGAAEKIEMKAKRGETEGYGPMWEELLDEKGKFLEKHSPKG